MAEPHSFCSEERRLWCCLSFANKRFYGTTLFTGGAFPSSQLFWTAVGNQSEKKNPVAEWLFGSISFYSLHTYCTSQAVPLLVRLQSPSQSSCSSLSCGTGQISDRMKWAVLLTLFKLLEDSWRMQAYQNPSVNLYSLYQVLIFLITLIMDSMKRRGKLIVKSSDGFSLGWILLLPSALKIKSQ